MPSFAVRDGSRIINFDGKVLAHSTTERPGAYRWTEQTLYKTDSGRWVVEKVGRTKVIHLPGCPEIRAKLNRFVDEYPGVEPEEPTWFLHSCIGDTYNLDKVLVEQTRYWAYITDDPAGVIEAVSVKRGSVRSMPRMSLELLEKASVLDAALAEEFRSTTV